MARSVNLTESLLDVFAEKKYEYFKKFTIRIDYDPLIKKSSKLLEGMCGNEDHFIGRLSQFNTQLQKRKRTSIANNVKGCKIWVDNKSPIQIKESVEDPMKGSVKTILLKKGTMLFFESPPKDIE